MIHCRVRRSRFHRSWFRRLVLEHLTERSLLAADVSAWNDPSSSCYDGWKSSNGTEVVLATNSGSESHGHAEHDDYLRYDAFGNAYYLDPLPPDVMSEAGHSGGGGSIPFGSGSNNGAIRPFALNVPVYHSNPSAAKKIYLDFDGQLVTGTTWNNQNYTGSYNTGNTINAPAFSTDPDFQNYSAAELSAIRNVWARVAEDFRPFQVDVTTENPGENLFRQGGQAIRVLVSTDIDGTTGQQWFANAGGVAYLGSWDWTNGSPVWVFYNRLSNNEKNIAEASSHEVGHAFGLSHDGRNSPKEGYYQGHGTGQTGWAPIMGVGYYKSLVQWSKGEYSSANQTEDDVSIIAGRVGFLADDHADVQAAATALAVDSSGAMSGSGVIATRTDKDWFRFATQAGSVSFNVAPFELSDGKANLDVQVRLLNSSGTVVSTINETNRLDTVWSGTLAKGIYSIEIDGVGKAAISGDEGYSDYGSLGSYTVGGSVIKNRDPILNLDQASVQGFEGTTLINTGTWSDPDNDSVVIAASIGAVTRRNDGTWEWNLAVGNDTPETVVDLTITDELGAATTASFTYLVSNRAPVLTVANAAVSGPVLGTLINSGTWSDVPADTVTLTASLGTIVKNNDGTWSWSYVPESAMSNQSVTISARDSNRGSSSLTFALDALVAVVNTKVYYRDSAFANTSVDNALDPSKVVMQSGGSSKTLSYANLINTVNGINGLVLDVAGLASVNLSAADFSFRISPPGIFDEASNPPSGWSVAPVPSTIVVTAGTSTTPARVRLEWPNYAIMNCWLQVKVLANSRTGLVANRSFYVGHLLGETTGTLHGGAYLVQVADVTRIRPEVGNTAAVSSALDLNKNGLVQVSDITSMRAYIGLLSLRNITIPPAGSSEEGEGGFDASGLFLLPAIETKGDGQAIALPRGDDFLLPRSASISSRLTSWVFTVSPINETARIDLSKDARDLSNDDSVATGGISRWRQSFGLDEAMVDKVFEEDNWSRRAFRRRNR